MKWRFFCPFSSHIFTMTTTSFISRSSSVAAFLFPSLSSTKYTRECETWQWFFWRQAQSFASTYNDTHEDSCGSIGTHLSVELMTHLSVVPMFQSSFSFRVNTKLCHHCFHAISQDKGKDQYKHILGGHLSSKTREGTRRHDKDTYVVLWLCCCVVSSPLF